MKKYKALFSHQWDDSFGILIDIKKKSLKVFRRSNLHSHKDVGIDVRLEETCSVSKAHPGSLVMNGPEGPLDGP